MESLYLETTIPSYLAGRPSRDVVVLGHQQITRTWWETTRPRYDLYISQVVIDEIQAGDPILAKNRMDHITGLPILDLTPAIDKLAREYAEILALPHRALTDAYHLAFSVEYELNYMLTWNCKHLANGAVRLKLQELNMKKNRHIPVIVTPEELNPVEEEE